MYVGHMRPPSGTTLFDVSDPRKPRKIMTIEVPPGWHSHKVRVQNGVMIVNHEKFGTGGPEDFAGGLAIYDVSKPSDPKQISKWMTAGKCVHRYDFDGRYAYISPTAEGYVGNIVMILDLIDPRHPVEVGRWWIPGQWAGGGEAYPWENYVSPRCHHPIRMGDRLYVSYWHHGFYILDISDITQESNPLPISTFQVPGLDPDGAPQEQMMGCHQPSERFSGNIIPFAWFAQGLRLVDISDPFAPKEVGHYIPDPQAGAERASSNDVTTDSRGLIYLVDRIGGVDIIESSAL